MKKLILVSVCAFLVLIAVSTDSYAKEVVSEKSEKSFKLSTNSPDASKLLQVFTETFAREENEKNVFVKAGLGKSLRYRLFYGLNLSF